MIEIPIVLSLAALGVFVGFISSMIGVGGGFLIIPTLILAFHLNTQQAVGTSLGMTIFTALSGTVVYLRQKRIDWKIGLITGLVTVPAATLGAYLTSFFSSQMLAFLFGIMITLLAVRIVLTSVRLKDKAGSIDDENPSTNPRNHTGVWHRNLVDSQGKVFQYDAQMLKGIALMFGVGFAAGLLGVGGGIMIVPVFTMVMGIPVHLAVATSLFVMLFTSISGVTVHVALGNVLLDYVVSLAAGIIFGAQLGAVFSRRLSGRTLEIYFGLSLIVVGITLMLTRLPV
ncbi:MAG: sulfite exporter TauE/SafE family protein [Thaumarchaeota archaeon]|nr:sulfite exporter TauE/SafE family protein [Nitrososphaerota archaeon]